MKPTHTQGFTLVELAVVLIIIGLIVGAISAGTNLVKNARLQAQVVQISEMKAATTTFVERYYDLPGDLPNAVALGLQDDDGNGNGSVSSSEADQFFMALSNAGLLKESYVDGTFPLAAIHNRGFIRPVFAFANNANYLTIAVAMNGTVSSGSLTGSEAYRIDLKTDDGLAYRGDSIVYYGTLMTIAQLSNYLAGTVPANTDCVQTAVAYDPASMVTIAKNGDVQQCPLLINLR